MGVGHTGIVIQLLHVGRNITVTRLFICRQGKQDAPITLLEIYIFLFYPLDIWHILAAVIARRLLPTVEPVFW